MRGSGAGGGRCCAETHWATRRGRARPTGTTRTARATSGWRCPTRRSACSWPRSTPRSCSSRMPDIFRGIGIDPLAAGNTGYLLWMLMGFMVVTAVLVVGLGRLGDMYGRVRIYNLGFLIFAVSSVLLAVDLDARRRRGAVADRLADRPGHRRRLPDGQLQRDPHRRLPGRPARHGAGHQRRRRDRRLVPRAGDRRPARPRQLAPGVPRVRAVRRVRHDLGLPQAARHRRTPPGPHGLVGQRHLRRRPDRGARRHHLRHPALRRPRHGLDQPVRPDLPHRRRRWCSPRSSPSS